MSFCKKATTSRLVCWTAVFSVDQVTVFAAVDHCTTECVGLYPAKKATRFEALEPLLHEEYRGDACLPKDLSLLISKTTYESLDKSTSA